MIRTGFILAGIAAALVVAFLALGGDRGRDRAPGDGGLDVACTTGMIADAARAILGDGGEVTSLMGPGVDPHLYQATRSDVRRLMEADVVLFNGLLLEGKMTDALQRLRRQGRIVRAVAESVAEAERLEKAGDAGETDPHLWMNPALWTGVVESIHAALAEAAPAREGEMASRAATYLDEVERLDAYAERVLATVPEDQRVLITAHDAFNYFGKRYGFEVLGIQGISTESEAGLLQIERLVDTIVDRGIPAVFVETTVSDRNIRALLEGAKARGHGVRIGGSLFSDAMGAPGTYEGTYLGMIDHNVTTIARALGGEAPERGMDGRLTDDAR